MRVLIILFAVLGVSALPARQLDYIDADGVTETGGAGKARMIPRTAADGRLDASLLPPVADWASQPIPGLRYVSPGAAAGGNGSPQYPYSSLATAFAESPSGTALLLAPASYDASVTLMGKTLTLVGCGVATRLENLTVGVGGTSSLAFVGCSAGVVTLNGAALPVRLHGTRVDAVHGTAPVTLVRMDMGSYVRAWTTTGAHTERYDGYDCVTNAVVLIGPGTSLQMGTDHPIATVSGVTKPIAYVSELTAATNRVYASLADLVVTNDQLVAAITTEAATRAAAVTQLKANLVTTSAVIRTEIDRIDTVAQAQASVLSGTISQVAGAFTNLSTTLQAEFNALSGEVDALDTAYKQADEALLLELTAGYEGGDADVRTDIPVIADERITVALTPVIDQLNTLIETVNDNHTAHTAEEKSLGDRITDVNNSIASLRFTLASVEATLATLIVKWNARFPNDTVNTAP